MCGFFCWLCFCFTPTGNHTGQPSRASRSPHPGPTALDSLRSPSLRRPRMGCFGRAGSIYRKNFTPPNQAPGQVRGRATGGWPAGRDEWERTSQITKRYTNRKLPCAWSCATCRAVSRGKLIQHLYPMIRSKKATSWPLFLIASIKSQSAVKLLPQHMAFFFAAAVRTR